MCVTNTTKRRPQALQLAVKLASSTSTSEASKTLSVTVPCAESHASTDGSSVTGITAAATHSAQSGVSSPFAYKSNHHVAILPKRPKRRRKAQKPGKTAKMNDRHFVVHNYHDHGMDEPDENDAPAISSGTTRRRGGVAMSFPLKLHSLLDQIEEDGLAHVISWQPHGRAFVVHKPKEFVDHVMPKYFRQTKITSFQRQLNLYGFARLTKGRDNRGYYHELFLRGKPFLCKRMVRTKVKGTGFKAASSPDQEPDFYMMPPITMAPASSATEDSSTTESSDHTEDSEWWMEDMVQSVSGAAAQQQEPTASPLLFVSVQAQEAQSSLSNEVASVTPAALPATNNSGDAILDEVVRDLFSDDVAGDDTIRDFVETWKIYDQPVETDLVDDFKLGNLLERFLAE